MLRLCLGEAMRIKRLASSVSAAKFCFFEKRKQITAFCSLLRFPLHSCFFKRKR